MDEYVSKTWFSRRTRKINGLKYHLREIITVKHLAQSEAKKMRNIGYNIRVIPEKMKRGSKYYQYGIWSAERRKK